MIGLWVTDVWEHTSRDGAVGPMVYSVDAHIMTL